jgi:ArsR family transcriptional regulator, arsenate/arsenite/antimonite-responsive transcriptional repressor
MDEQEVVKSLAALAQPVRLKVFRALVVRGREGLTPGTMAEALDLPPNTLSFHLKELAHAGLVTQERSSRNIIYRAAYTQMDELLAYLTENCCQGIACTAPVARAKTLAGALKPASSCR